MTTSEYLRKLVEVLQSHAPDDDAAETVNHMVERARVDGARDEDIELMLVDALADGLRAGNWPWLVGPVREATADEAWDGSGSDL